MPVTIANSRDFVKVLRVPEVHFPSFEVNFRDFVKVFQVLEDHILNLAGL